MDVRDFWYIAAQSSQLGRKKPLPAKILDEWIVLFRDGRGCAVAMQDRCLHRSARLSAGKVRGGRVECPYHGWTYNGDGEVVKIPSEGPGKPRIGAKCATLFKTREQDGYIYVCLSKEEDLASHPFRIAHYGEPGWHTIRVIHRFSNTVTNCAENFVDIPHTVSVHPGIFRTKRNQKIVATIERRDGNVLVNYENETTNLGVFSWFLNPTRQKIVHTDAFYMPNITKVSYDMGSNRRFIITSQSVPESEYETRVYTDLTYNYGIWNKLAIPFVWLQAKIIIWQDIVILKNQMETIRKYGDKFHNSPADLIHTMIESVRNAILEGKDPRELSHKIKTVEFWV